MKVALISSSYHPYAIGGGERSAQRLAEGLKARGIDVFVITAFDHDVTEVVNGIKVYRVKHPNIYWSYHAEKMPGYKKILWHLIESYNLNVKGKVAPILKHEKPDIVQIRNYQNFSSIIWKILYELGLPVVQTLNDYTSLCYKSAMYRSGKNCTNQCKDCKLVTWPRKRLSRYVDAVVGVSQYTLHQHTKRSYFPKAEESVVYTTPTPYPYKALPLLKNKLVTFGVIGRVHPSKGILETIDAFIQADSSLSKLVIAGDGPDDYFQLCQQRANNNDRILFLGKVNPEDFYNIVDIVVIPSIWHEPFPRVLIEAYSYGRPVIVTRQGGTHEQVSEGKTGFIFDVNHFEQLSQYIGQLSVNAYETIMEMHQNCIDFVQKQQKKTDIDSYINIYHSVIKNHN